MTPHSSDSDLFRHYVTTTENNSPSRNTTPTLLNFNLDTYHVLNDHPFLNSTTELRNDIQKKTPDTLDQDADAADAVESNNPPDGGRQAWLTVFGGLCCNIVSFGWIGCIGVFQAFYEENQLKDVPTSTATWITSLESFMMFIGGPFFGTLFDMYGPRWVLLAGTFLHVFGLMMTSISSSYYQFLLAQGICSPIGASAIYHASINSVGTWFQHRRALALGITASGSGVGGVFLPIMVNHLIKKIGFGWTMRICAFVILFFLIIANLTVQSRLSHRRKSFVLAHFIHPLKEPRFVLTTAATFCFFWGIFLPFTFIGLQAERYGTPPYLAGYLIPILNAASIFGRIVPSFLADVFGRFNMMIIATTISAILVIALWLPSRTNSTAIAFSALYGFSSGTVVALAPAIVAQISDVRQIGTRTGTYFALASFGALTGTPIGGALVKNALKDSYWRLQVFTAAVMFAGAFFFVLARVCIAGWSLKKIV